MAEFLSGAPAAPCTCCLDNVTLPPELERFAIEAVATGRYRDLEVLAAGLELLQRADAEVAAFVDSLKGACPEADRDADQIIAAKRGAG
jgi:Arc/MetJ-type ribon-helix-helix transcriptional regulator